MGSSKSKERISDATLKIEFSDDNRAFDANNPITGVIKINSTRDIPAYSLTLKLEMVDTSRK